MKALKLLIAFIVILGMVVGALYLTGAMGGDDETGGADPETFNKLSASLDEKWNSVEWNSDLYDECLISLEQDEHKLGTEGMNTLIDKLNEYAIPKLHTAMMGEFAKANCDNNIIQSLNKDLEKLKKTGRTGNTKFTEMTGTYNVYQKALSFCSKPIAFDPGNGTSWVPLNTQKQNYIQTRNAIKGDPYYKNIQNIKRITDSLNGLDAKINAAAANFSSAVADRIYNYYSKNRNYNAFVNTKKTYNSQFGTNQKLENLDDELYYSNEN